MAPVFKLHRANTHSMVTTLLGVSQGATSQVFFSTLHLSPLSNPFQPVSNFWTTEIISCSSFFELNPFLSVQPTGAIFMMCYHEHSVSKSFSLPQTETLTTQQWLIILPFPSPWWCLIYFLCLWVFTGLDNSYKWASYNVCPFVSGLFHWAEQFQVHPSWSAYQDFAPLHGWIILHGLDIPFCFSIHPSTDTWAAFIFGLLLLRLQWILSYKYLLEFLLSILLDAYQGEQSLGHMWHYV